MQAKAYRHSQNIYFSLSLFQSGDVQSACLITGQNLSALSKANSLVSAWFEGLAS